MNRIVRRLRGALGLGILWGIAGALVGGVIEGVLNVLPGSDLFLGVDMWPAALAIPGFLAGVAFSTVLWMVEGRRSFDALRLPRIALWGALGGLVLGAVVGLPAIGIAVLSLTSGASAAGSLALARRAQRQDSVGDGTDAHAGTLESP
jgi:hypothetical protein